jgi:hypothetical protein
MMQTVDVINGDALIERFGNWPSFHDAEVLAVRLDSGQRSDGVVRLQLDIHLLPVDGQRHHTLATLEFEEIEEVELDGFGPQNVLFDLVLEEVRLAAGRQIQVELQSSNGLGGTFRCRQIVVVGVEPHEPGPHSVYGR